VSGPRPARRPAGHEHSHPAVHDRRAAGSGAARRVPGLRTPRAARVPHLRSGDATRGARPRGRRKRRGALAGGREPDRAAVARLRGRGGAGGPAGPHLRRLGARGRRREAAAGCELRRGRPLGGVPPRRAPARLTPSRRSGPEAAEASSRAQHRPRGPGRGLGGGRPPAGRARSGLAQRGDERHLRTAPRRPGLARARHRACRRPGGRRGDGFRTPRGARLGEPAGGLRDAPPAARAGLRPRRARGRRSRCGPGHGRRLPDRDADRPAGCHLHSRVGTRRRDRDSRSDRERAGARGRADPALSLPRRREARTPARRDRARTHRSALEAASGHAATRPAAPNLIFFDQLYGELLSSPA
jgi:hypothetical protein